MNKKLLLLNSFVAIFCATSEAQFVSTAINLNIPTIEYDTYEMGRVFNPNYALIDMNGDGFPDLVDSEDNALGNDHVWTNGTQRFWKVYFNNGTSISPTAVNWNLPNIEYDTYEMGRVFNANYGLIDMNGDGFPDLVDAEDNALGNNHVWTNGTQRYWKVYLNNGTSISPTAVNWNLPNVEYDTYEMGMVSDVNYSLIDMNGDGFPDLVDAEDNALGNNHVWTNGTQRYWKVYLNNGTSISPTAVNWNLPNVEYGTNEMGMISNLNYSLIDMNGDGFPDLVDAEDNALGNDHVWTNGSQRFWKVYLNNGTSISPTAVNWNLPNIEYGTNEMGRISDLNYGLVDMNGDGFPDLVDAEDNALGNNHVWTNGAQRYWKVYLNNGTSISATAVTWNLPNVEYDTNQMGRVFGINYSLVDMNGDGGPDLIDAEDNALGNDNVWTNGTQRYWKVYLNAITTGVQTFVTADLLLSAYPNPFIQSFSVDLLEIQPSVTLSIMDMSGRVIQSETYSDTQFLNIMLDEPAGVYLMMVETEVGKTVTRLIKE
jgi:hypothetical protein